MNSGLSPADEGANVVFLRPPNTVPYLLTETVDGLTYAAPSQIVIDCLSGPGRMPAEGEAVLEWMSSAEDTGAAGTSTNSPPGYRQGECVTDIDSIYVAARRVLLDALQALQLHSDSMVLIGAQAVYVRTERTELAIAPFTTDADIALNPTSLGSTPEISRIMEDAHFAWAKRQSRRMGRPVRGGRADHRRSRGCREFPSLWQPTRDTGAHDSRATQRCLPEAFEGLRPSSSTTTGWC